MKTRGSPRSVAAIPSPHRIPPRTSGPPCSGPTGTPGAPNSAYTWSYGLHSAAGEDIRILPVTTDWPTDVPSKDFWLFDSTALFDMHYHPEGCWLGIEPVTDPAKIVAGCFARDAALYHAIPWRAYLAERPELERRLIPAWR